MPKNAVISNLPPMSCPSSNKNIRKIGNNLGKRLRPMMTKHKIKPKTMLHLDSGHKVLWVADAPNAEAVRDFCNDNGLSTWNNFEFYMASSLEDFTS